MASTIRIILAETAEASYAAEVRAVSVGGPLNDPLYEGDVIPTPNNPNTGIVIVSDDSNLEAGRAYHLTIRDEEDGYVYASLYFVFHPNRALALFSDEATALLYDLLPKYKEGQITSGRPFVVERNPSGDIL